MYLLAHALSGDNKYRNFIPILYKQVCIGSIIKKKNEYGKVIPFESNLWLLIARLKTCYFYFLFSIPKSQVVSRDARKCLQIYSGVSIPKKKKKNFFPMLNKPKCGWDKKKRTKMTLFHFLDIFLFAATKFSPFYPISKRDLSLYICSY